ncbi:hypothetical protein JYG34_16430 [Pseudomonas entomophila]|uniref:hypothetical protein n=1 Tax=Pseudomonas entomophila TaxID=312306 RepID=UPI001BCB48FD|nr:hypothetical protein [Pseudomonas entomophila]QVM89607.1 hypothetical protein JYG34_16430 [Pseudomonas entomophila]
MNGTFLKCLVMLGLASLVGCAEEPPNTFKLVGELPSNFVYAAVAHYEPEPGAKCVLADWGRAVQHFNREWDKEYEPTSTIVIRKVVDGCSVVVSSIKIRIIGIYGDAFHQASENRAGIGVYAELDEKYRRVMSAGDGDTFYGECQWLFRTMGKERYIRKVLLCKKDKERGEKFVGNPFGAYLVDQLPGKTIRMNIRVVESERPYFKDTWVKFPRGWKRCLGKGVDDLYGYCRGNYSDFIDFKMPDGRICNLYPSCEE